MTILYFAYGSNMLSERLAIRIQSAKTVGRGVLYEWYVNFSKKSKDGSGKANLLPQTGSITWGVIYEVSLDDMIELDKIEKGYSRKTIRVKKDNGEIIDAETYISDELTDNPVANEPYKQKVISGAIENNLPPEYIEYLRQLPSRVGI